MTVEEGIPKSAAVRHFGVSLSSVKRYPRIAQRGVSLVPRKGGGRPPKTDQTTHKLLKGDLQERPTSYRLRKASLPEAGYEQVPDRLHCKAATQRVGLQPKKRTFGTVERDEWLRTAWRVTVAREIAAERLVFVDEMDTNISLRPLYAWSPRGERAHCFVSRNRGLNTMLLASMTVEGIAPCLAVEGATTGGIVFEAYIERVLQVREFCRATDVSKSRPWYS